VPPSETGVIQERLSTAEENMLTSLIAKEKCMHGEFLKFSENFQGKARGASRL
jgi:hypothetical protein